MNFRAMALAGTMLAALSLAACGDDESETASDTAPTTSEGTVATGEATQEPAAGEAGQAPAAPETAAEGASDGAPALAALAGVWAESEEACASRTITFSDSTIKLPRGECQVEGSDIGDGTLSLHLACGDAGAQDWAIDGAQDEAEPRQITLDRGEGEAIELVRCE